MARPRIEIDWEQFKKLCFMQATLEEIAGWYDCSVDTIERAVKREKKMGFADYYKKESAGGKVSLRRKQHEIALSGNTTMLIWLGKQYLGQKDKTELSGDQESPLNVEVNVQFVESENDG